MEESYLIGFDDLVEITAAIFCGSGLTREDALMLSRSLASADMRGVKSHGVVRVPTYLGQFANGQFNAKAELETIKETLFSLTLDGHNGSGQVISQKAVDKVREKAEKNGIAVAAVRKSNHFGASAYWAELLAGDDMIGFAASNTIAIVSAPTGIERSIGSNPFAFCIPAKKYAPINLDISGAVMAQGKIHEYIRLGKPLPADAMLGPNGEETTDPTAFDPSEYILRPFSAHKGFGLSVVMEMLTSNLSGSAFHKDAANTEGAMPENCHIFGAMRIDAFDDLDAFKERVDTYIEYLHSIPAKPGFPPVYYPGEIEAAYERGSREDGILLAAKVLDQLLELAKSCDIDLSKLNYKRAEAD